MKFSTYDPTVKTNNIQGEIRVPSDRAAWGISTNSLDDAGKALRSIGLAIGQRQEEADRQTILKAMNLYNQGQYGLMYNEEDGLMNTKLEGSDGIDGTYLSRERELRNKVLGVTKLHDKKNMLALTNLMDKSAMQGFQAVDRHRQQQHEKVLDINLENNVQALIAKTIKDPSAIEDAMTQMGLLTSLRYQGQGEEILDAVQRQQGTRIVSAVLNDELQKENYAGARETLNSWGHCLDAKQLAAYEHAVYTKERAKAELDRGVSLVDKYYDDIGSIRNELQNDETLSDEARIRIMKNATAELSFREQEKKNYINQSYIAFSNDISEKYRSGVTYNQAMKYARERAGAQGEDVLNRNLSIVNNIYGYGNNGFKMAKGAKEALIYQLQNASALGFKLPRDFNMIDFMEIAKTMTGDRNELLELRKLGEDYFNGTGVFAIPNDVLDRLCTEVQGQYNKNTKGGSQKEALREGAKVWVRLRSAEFMKEEGRAPYESEIRPWVKEAFEKRTFVPPRNTENGRLYAASVEIEPAKLHQYGIKNISQYTFDPVDRDYFVKVIYRDGSEQFMSVSQANQRLGMIEKVIIPDADYIRDEQDVVSAELNDID